MAPLTFLNGAEPGEAVSDGFASFVGGQFNAGEVGLGPPMGRPSGELRCRTFAPRGGRQLRALRTGGDRRRPLRGRRRLVGRGSRPLPARADAHGRIDPGLPADRGYSLGSRRGRLQNRRPDDGAGRPVQLVSRPGDPADARSSTPPPITTGPRSRS